MLHANNAYSHLPPLGRELGLIDGHMWTLVEQNQARIVVEK
jgi:tRNA U34 5-carboxymethylaminomethyl modifying enzyme MnmG/GidA